MSSHEPARDPGARAAPTSHTDATDTANDAAQRQTTFGASEQHRAKSFAIEDERWTRGAQLRDWGRLALMIGVFLLWTLLIYWLEPGLR